jgi:hypothetical protein
VEVNYGWGDTVIVMVGLPDMTMKKLLPTQAMDTCRLSRIRTKDSFPFAVHLAAANIIRKTPPRVSS